MLLVILDGFGNGSQNPFNAVQNAKMPFFKSLLKEHPYTQLQSHGESVGLPKGVMGNSEVGHLTLGAGRILDQDLTRIQKDIDSGSFFKNEAFLKACHHSKASGSQLHLMGLLSEGGVHSHVDHLKALLELTNSQGVQPIVHLFCDGRDSSVEAALPLLEKIQKEKAFTLGTLIGRFYAMDRDQRTERTQAALKALLGEQAVEKALPSAFLKACYEKAITDEFIPPTRFAERYIQAQDSVIFFNFRSDRARQLTAGLIQKVEVLVTMTSYDLNFTKAIVAYPPQKTTHFFGEWLESHQKRQLRLAETEKYAHVTFFFNGGREKPFEGEERILIPSPKNVKTYDLQPEMSAFAITDTACQKMREGNFDFILVNYANADMVGHTGNYESAVKACEILDLCLQRLVAFAKNFQTTICITADHGNAEEMCDEQGRIHTQHTLNPVPFVLVPFELRQAVRGGSMPRVKLKEGNLSNVMPTLCEIMQLPTPEELESHSLLI